MSAAATDAEMLDRVRRRLADSDTVATPATVIEAVRAEQAVGADHAVRADQARGADEVPGRATARTLVRLGEHFYDEIVGAGPLSALVADPEVTDVVVNGPDDVWVDRGAGMQRAAVSFPDAEAVRRLAQRLAAAGERRLDGASPYVDARLPDGTRMHAVIAPVAVHGPYLSLRTFRARGFSVDDLVAHGTLDVDSAGIVTAIVQAGLAYLVSGGAGSGKTTLLSTMLGLVPYRERIIVVEDSAELNPAHPHVVALQARLSNVEGAGEVTVRDLVRQALRMRPDRLVIGECRGAEIVDLLSALNTGHEGGAGTLHANAAADVPARLEALGHLGGISREALHAQVAAGLKLVLHLSRAAGRRRLEEISLLLPAGPTRLLRAVPAWRRTNGLGPAALALALQLEARGCVVPPVLAGQA